MFFVFFHPLLHSVLWVLCVSERWQRRSLFPGWCLVVLWYIPIVQSGANGYSNIAEDWPALAKLPRALLQHLCEETSAMSCHLQWRLFSCSRMSNISHHTCLVHPCTHLLRVCTFSLLFLFSYISPFVSTTSAPPNQSLTDLTEPKNKK
jgi:hypothetical protein